MSPHLVIITLEGCNPCRIFKEKVLPELLEMKIPNIIFHHINRINGSDNFPTTYTSGGRTFKYPPDLSNWVMGYPMILLISESSWDKNIVDNKTKLDVEAFQWKKVDGKLVADFDSKLQRDANNIRRWIEGSKFYPSSNIKGLYSTYLPTTNGLPQFVPTAKRVCRNHGYKLLSR